MHYKIEARAEPSRAMAIAAPLIATGLTVVISSLFFLSLGLNPFYALYFLRSAIDDDERNQRMVIEGLTFDLDRLRVGRWISCQRLEHWR